MAKRRSYKNTIIARAKAAASKFRATNRATKKNTSRKTVKAVRKAVKG